MFSMLAQGLTRIGFFGVHGLVGVLLALLCFFVIVWGIWKVFDIVAAKFGTPESSWMFQIAKVILIVATFLYFVQLVFGIFG
jgi:hypothetical protein